VFGGPGVAPPEDRVEVVGAGSYGRVTDPTPNANYTASMNDAPTPDTDISPPHVCRGSVCIVLCRYRWGLPL
jgi:hypothetical protein